MTTLTLTATPTGSFTYAFSSGAAQIGTGNTATVNAPGVYTLTVTDVNGCTSFTTTEVFSETTVPTVTLANNNSLNCAVTSATLTAMATGVGSLTYAFTGGNLTSSPSTNSTVTVNAPGTYTVLITAANGCRVANATTVSSDTALPSASISLSSATLTCSATSVTLTASQGNSFRWEDNSSDPVRTVKAEGTYSVTVTNANGCTNITSTMVSSNTTTPTVSLASSNSLNCVQPSATLRATATGFGALTYAFRNNTGLLAGSPSSSSTATVNQPGTYTVLVTDANGCSNSATTTVASDTALPTNLSLTSGTLTCAQTSLTLTASATNGTSFTFSGGTPLGSNQLVVNQPGTYTVIVSNANGCTATTTATIPANTTAPSVNISPSTGLLTRTTTSLTLTANTDAAWRRWRWSDGSTGPTLVVSTSGTYGLSVTATNGCTATATPVSIGQDLSALAGLMLGSSSPAFDCGGGTITLTATPVGADSYRFGGPSLNQTGNQPTALATQTGVYTVTATKGICTATASISLGGYCRHANQRPACGQWQSGHSPSHFGCTLNPVGTGKLCRHGSGQWHGHSFRGHWTG